MTALQFPCTLFKTQNRMDDYSAQDMRCGDLTAEQLKSNYGPVDISTRSLPHTLQKVTPFTQPQSMFYGSRGEGEKISRPQCANILFDELRDLSRLFSVYGPYKHLIKRMITHMQNGNGKPFSSIHLDNALKAHIVNDETENSTLSKIKYALNENINWQTGIYPVTGKNEFQKAILEGKLPKFDRFQDNFNGMGITVHDTWATEITIKIYRLIITITGQSCITKSRITLDLMLTTFQNSGLTSSVFFVSGLSSSDTISSISNLL